MEVAAASLNEKRRLNPFCLPSDTDCRFVLLIVTVLGATLFLFNSMSFRGFNVQAYQACLSLEPSSSSLSGGIGSPLEVRDPSELLARSAAFSQCVLQAQHKNAEWMLAGVALVSFGSLVIVFFLPVIKIRRGHLEPLQSEDASEAIAALRDMCAQAGLREHPVFLWNPLNSAITGLAFGRPRQHYVALSGGLVTKYYTDPNAFRAIVLHELAHLRNADVNKTYFAVAIWYAFLAVALAPFLVTMSRDLTFLEGWRLLALAALVYLARNSVLRIRENYADVRASVWEHPETLRRVISCLKDVDEKNLWRRLWRVHPSPADRSRVLGNTAPLFNVSSGETFVAGLACGVALPNLQLLLQTVTTGAIQVGILATSVFAALIAGIVGTKMWRASLAASAGECTTPRTVRLGLALAMGLVLGLQFSFSAALNVNPPSSGSGPGILVWNVLAIVFLIASLVAFLQWEVTTASVWLESVASQQSPTVAYVIGRVVSTLFLAVILGSLMTAWQSGQTYLAAGLPEFIALVLIGLMVAVTQPLLSAVLISLWAFPLAAWFWRSHAEVLSSRWIFLDQQSEPVASSQRYFFQPRTAVRAAVLSGAVFLVLHLMIRLPWHYSQPSTGASDTSKLVFYYSQVGVAVLIQVAAAIWVALRVRALPVAHGMFAAFVAGALMSIVFLVTGMAFGGGAQFKYITDLSMTMINIGAIASLIVVAIAMQFSRAGTTLSSGDGRPGIATR